MRTTAAGLSKGSVSGYLNDIEGAVRCRIVRERPVIGHLASMLKKNDTDLSRVNCGDGMRMSSVRDFYSFRVTWATVALELVQKVMGTKTTDIVLKHYFKPGREAFREADECGEDLWEIMERVMTKASKKDRSQLTELMVRFG